MKRVIYCVVCVTALNLNFVIADTNLVQTTNDIINRIYNKNTEYIGK